MAYARNMRAATVRHFQDAELLFERSRFNNAGYHYGLSAECALKGVMERVGINFDEVEVDGRVAYYVHFLLMYMSAAGLRFALARCEYRRQDMQTSTNGKAAYAAWP
jgi:hypothetical protein